MMALMKGCKRRTFELRVQTSALCCTFPGDCESTASLNCVTWSSALPVSCVTPGSALLVSCITPASVQPYQRHVSRCAMVFTRMQQNTINCNETTGSGRRRLCLPNNEFITEQNVADTNLHETCILLQGSRNCNRAAVQQVAGCFAVFHCTLQTPLV